MKIKAIEAECKDGMVAVELAYITSCKARGARTSTTPAVGVTLRESTSNSVDAAVVASGRLSAGVEHSPVQMGVR